MSRSGDGSALQDGDVERIEVDLPLVTGAELRMDDGRYGNLQSAADPEAGFHTVVDQVGGGNDNGFHAVILVHHLQARRDLLGTCGMGGAAQVKGDDGTRVTQQADAAGVAQGFARRIVGGPYQGEIVKQHGNDAAILGCGKAGLGRGNCNLQGKSFIGGVIMHGWVRLGGGTLC